MLIPLFCLSSFAEGLENKADTVADEETSFYAIIKRDTREKKLYMEGDMLYSISGIGAYLRIHEIKKDALILKDVNSGDTFTVKLGERIPLDGVDMVFERIIRPDVAEFEFTGARHGAWHQGQ